VRTTELLVEALAEVRASGQTLPEERFWQLVERYRADLVNQALAVLGNQADAEDVAQESLCQAFMQLHQLNDPAKVGAWLRSINRCNALDARRRRRSKREQRLATGEAAVLTAGHFPGRGRPSGAVPLDREAGQVVGAVETLPDPYREVVILRYWEKLTLEQIADKLGVPAGTVRSRMARADELLLHKLNALRKTEEHPR